MDILGLCNMYLPELNEPASPRDKLSLLILASLQQGTYVPRFWQ